MAQFKLLSCGFTYLFLFYLGMNFTILKLIIYNIGFNSLNILPQLIYNFLNVLFLGSMPIPYSNLKCVLASNPLYNWVWAYAWGPHLIVWQLSLNHMILATQEENKNNLYAHFVTTHCLSFCWLSKEMNYFPCTLCLI